MGPASACEAFTNALVPIRNLVWPKCNVLSRYTLSHCFAVNVVAGSSCATQVCCAGSTLQPGCRRGQCAREPGGGAGHRG